MPSAPISNPPLQQKAATTPAFRGPARSSQPPQSAAEEPSTTKNNVYIQPRSPIVQSHVVLTRGREQALVGTGVGLADPDRARQRQPEHAEAVSHADAQMDRQRAGRHQPTIIPRPRNGPGPIENTHGFARDGAADLNSTHAFILPVRGFFRLRIAVDQETQWCVSQPSMMRPGRLWSVCNFAAQMWDRRPRDRDSNRTRLHAEAET